MRFNRWRTLGAALVVLALGLLMAPAGAQDDLVVTVTPGFGLEDGDTVDVIGSGFVPNSVVFLAICNNDPALGSGPVDRCSLVGAGSAGYRVAVDGTLGVNDVTISTGQIGGSPDAICEDGVTTCSLHVTLEDLTVLVQVELGFGSLVELATTGTATTMMEMTALSLLAVGGLLVASGYQLEGRQLAPRIATSDSSSIREPPLWVW